LFPEISAPQQLMRSLKSNKKGSTSGMANQNMITRDEGYSAKSRFAYLSNCCVATEVNQDSKAIEALGLKSWSLRSTRGGSLSPTELAQRGYPLDGEVASPAILPEDERVRVSANG
jgi:hypothetical protein